MTEKEKRRFTVITNNDIDLLEQEREREFERERHADVTTPPDMRGYQTNPMYEKLLGFKELQKKKRFTVEDLLKW